MPTLQDLCMYVVMSTAVSQSQADSFALGEAGSSALRC